MPPISSTALLAAALAVLAVPACRPAELGGPPIPPQVRVLALRLASASRQTGRAGEVVGSPPAVQVVDSAGKPIAGVEVAFTVSAGGGSVSPATAVTGVDGVARTAWQLGAEVGADQELRATAAEVPGAAVDLSALVLASTAGYKVDLRLLTDATDADWAAFTAAAARIAEVVTGGLTPLTIGGTSCGGQAYSGTVEDLLILVRIHPIDGAGGVLGEAGPCVARLSNHLPALGIMNFDSADLAGLEANGHLDTVILHEMLHVVGFGTAWPSSLVHDPGKADSAFTGPQALAAALGWNGAPGSWTSVPLENCGAASPTPCGTGTQDAHWLEPVFRNELMTGWVSAADPGNPLSRTTAGSLADLGYAVNLDAADAFDLATAGLRAEAAPSEAEPDLYLGDDVLRLPLELAP